MASPSDGGPPKKPQPSPGAKPAHGQPAAQRPAGAPGGKPAPRPAQGQQPAKPGAPAGKLPPGARPPAPKPATPGGKPPAAKAPGDKPAGAKPAPKPAAKKPDKARKGGGKGDAVALRGKPKSMGGRRIGQVLIDLGFIDEDQLWELLDEAKNSGAQLGQVAM